MDETLLELVSRSLDGDLDKAEAASLEERERTDAEVASEIETTRELRAAIGALAEGMAPPATLDKVMEPLRRSDPDPTPRVRPAYRWLGAAAAVVLGVTVALEVAQRNPEPSLGRPASQRGRPLVQETEEIFALAPLPTANPEEKRPFGATDRLLEEEPALPAAPEPSPLEVMGPLRTGEAVAGAKVAPEPVTGRQSVGQEFEDPPITRPQPAATKKSFAQETAVSAGAGSAPPRGARLSKRVDDPPRKARLSDAGKAEPATTGGEGMAAAIPVVLHVGGVAVWSGSVTECPVGIWQALAEVRNGRVVSVDFLHDESGNPPEVIDESCLPKTLMDSVLTGVVDGVHPAVIVIGGR